MKIHRSFSTAIRAYRKAESRLNRFVRYLHSIALRDACKGDLFIGWDMVTLRICRPDDYSRLIQLQKQLANEAAQVRWFSVVAPLPLQFS